MGNRMGYWSIDVGVSVPRVRKSYRAREKAARIERDMATADFEAAQIALRATENSLMAQYQKWKRLLMYYHQTALPTAREQQKGAAAAYRLGATDYIGFIQTMGDAVQTELDYWTAYEQLLQTQIDLQYLNL